ncbi:MAG: 50S ribosomal protein L29 [Thermodesulfobacteriota bacterium]
MESSEIRGMSVEEIDGQLKELVESYFNLRFQHKTGQLESPTRIKQIRRDIARVKTIRREKEINLS